MTFTASEFDKDIEPTGTELVFVANDLEQAIQHLLYTLQLKNGSASIGPSGKVVYDGFGNAYSFRKDEPVTDTPKSAKIKRTIV